MIPIPDTDTLDSPETIRAHKEMILNKPFLKRLYEDYYSIFCDAVRPLDALPGVLVELGSGGGFMKDMLPEVITSDLCAGPGIDRVFSADQFPFREREVKGILLLNVFHHLANPRAFLREADRVLCPSGRMIMIEPFNSLWGFCFYRYLHHEPFEPGAKQWELDPKGRLTTSNQALPWIVFHRDRHAFEQEFPRLKIIARHPHTVTRYLLSGGLSVRTLVPVFSYPLWRALDRWLAHLARIFPVFETIILEKT